MEWFTLIFCNVYPCSMQLSEGIIGVRDGKQSCDRTRVRVTVWACLSALSATYGLEITSRNLRVAIRRSRFFFRRTCIAGSFVFVDLFYRRRKMILVFSNLLGALWFCTAA